jgi:branched-chain amino acid transport system permease protein
VKDKGVDNWAQNIVKIIIGGIESGSVYILIAVGLSLLYGVTKIFNYSFGSLLTIGGYFAWVLITNFSAIHYGLSIVVILPVMFFMGMGIERLIVFPLRRKAEWELNVVIATLGLALIFNSLILTVFGPLIKTLPPIIEGNIKIGDYVFSNYRWAILIITIVVMAALRIFLTKTKLGMAMRAVAQDSVGGQIVGINTSRLFGYTFGISTVLAGLGGIFLGSSYFLAPEGGWLFFVKAFIIVALGGIGSLQGALIAAIILGIIESAISFLLGAVWVTPAWFIVLIIILIIRPRGLFGIR